MYYTFASKHCVFSFLVVCTEARVWKLLKEEHDCTVVLLPDDAGSLQCEIQGPGNKVQGCINEVVELVKFKPEVRSKLHPRNLKHDKRLACLYCDAMPMHRVKHHLELHHINEPEVAAASTTSNKAERLKAFAYLKNRGNFAHNIKFLNGEKDQFIPSRRSANIDPKKYLPCLHCYGFYRDIELWRHDKHCEFNQNNGDDGAQRISVTVQAPVMLSAATMPDLAMKSPEVIKAFAKRHAGPIKRAIVDDKILVRLASVLLCKLGERRRNGAMQRLRQLARLKIACGATTIKELITGPKFDHVLDGVKEICAITQNEEGIKTCKSPSTALTLGHNIKKAAAIVCGYAVRCNDEKEIKDAETFLKLMRMEWADEISSIAITSLKVSHHNRPSLLPMTDDLIKLKKYLYKTIETCQKLLCSGELTAVTWREMAEATLTWILLFNKRRSSEVSMMLISSYKDRPDWKKTTNKELVGSFTVVEKMLLDK